MDITLVRDRSGVWEGIYIDGLLKYQREILVAEDILDALNQPFTVRESHIRVGGRLPLHLEDVPEPYNGPPKVTISFLD